MEALGVPLPHGRATLGTHDLGGEERDDGDGDGAGVGGGKRAKIAVETLEDEESDAVLVVAGRVHERDLGNARVWTQLCNVGRPLLKQEHGLLALGRLLLRLACRRQRGDLDRPVARTPGVRRCARPPFDAKMTRFALGRGTWCAGALRRARRALARRTRRERPRTRATHRRRRSRRRPGRGARRESTDPACCRGPLRPCVRVGARGRTGREGGANLA